MTLSQTPAPARSDVAVGPTLDPARSGRPFLRHGLLLATGALAWAAAMAVVGLDPQHRGGVIIFSLCSGLFQLGLLALLRVLSRTLLDAFWPLSMLGMFLIGIRIAVAGRWRGARRFWPMVAESWAVVCIPTLMVAGPAVAAVVAPLHLLLGYVVLGLLVATKRSAD